MKDKEYHHWDCDGDCWSDLDFESRRNQLSSLLYTLSTYAIGHPERYDTLFGIRESMYKEDYGEMPPEVAKGHAALKRILYDGVDPKVFLRSGLWEEKAAAEAYLTAKSVHKL